MKAIQSQLTLTSLERRLDALETQTATVETSALIIREMPGDIRTAETVRQITSGRPVVILPPKAKPEEWEAMVARVRS